MRGLGGGGQGGLEESGRCLFVVSFTSLVRWTTGSRWALFRAFILHENLQLLSTTKNTLWPFLVVDDCILELVANVFLHAN